MYAYIRKAWREFFEGVCTPSNATAHFHDLPRNAKEPKPRPWGSGPKWTTRCATVDGALA
jgi:hypothetical protein